MCPTTRSVDPPPPCFTQRRRGCEQCRSDHVSFTTTCFTQRQRGYEQCRSDHVSRQVSSSVDPPPPPPFVNMDVIVSNALVCAHLLHLSEWNTVNQQERHVRFANVCCAHHFSVTFHESSHSPSRLHTHATHRYLRGRLPREVYAAVRHRSFVEQSDLFRLVKLYHEGGLCVTHVFPISVFTCWILLLFFSFPHF